MAPALPITIIKKLPVPLPLTRRIVALDPGNGCLRAILLEEFLGTIRVIKSARLPRTPAEQDPAESLPTRVRRLLDDMGDYPVAIVLRQDHVTAQIIDIAVSSAEEVNAFIAEEALKLRGLSESLVVYDHSRVTPFGRFQNPYWVTLCLETEIFRQLDTLGLNSDFICEVSPAADSLFNAYASLGRKDSIALLADIGTTGTLVVLVHEGEMVAAATTTQGGNTFTQRLAKATGVDFVQAEQEKIDARIGERSAAGAPLASAADEWWSEIDRLTQDWARSMGLPKDNTDSPKVLICGGGGKLNGLLDHLNHSAKGLFEPWPEMPGFAPGEDASSYQLALGIGHKVLGRPAVSTSLLPEEVQSIWRDRLGLLRLQSAGFFLATLAALALIVATGRQLALGQQTRARMVEAQTANRILDDYAQTYKLLNQRYERLRPILSLQTNTQDTLTTLSRLSQLRTNHTYWLILYADQASYLAKPAATTNGAVPYSPNSTQPSRGFIAELTIPKEGEAMRQELSDVVAQLKKSGLYQNVDAIPSEARRKWVDNQLVLADKTFALGLNLRELPLSPLPPFTDTATPYTTNLFTPPRTAQGLPSGFRRPTPSRAAESQ